MNGLRRMLSRLRGVLSRDGSDIAFDAELESHLQLHVDDNVRAGMSPVEARREAVLALGGLEPARQRYREQSSLPWVEHLGQDLRFALRHLIKAPGFTVTALLTMTLGFGAALSIYAFVDAAMVRPLPYSHPDRLVDVTERTPEIPHANLSYRTISTGKHGKRSSVRSTSTTDKGCH